jgi:Na+/H+ antiporter NhaC
VVNGTGSEVRFALMKSAHRRILTGLLAGIVGSSFGPPPLAAQSLDEAPRVFVDGVPFDLTVRGSPTGISVYRVETAQGAGLADGQVAPDSSLVIPNLVVESAADLPLVALVGDRLYRVSGQFLPGWVSVVPPLVALALALVFKDVVIALFVAVWVGSLAIHGFNPILATLRTIDEFVVGALADSSGRAQTALALLLFGGMVGVISRNGGLQGIAAAVTARMTRRRHGKLAAGATGVAVFFDDYASALIAGTSMRGVTDRLGISREKLAFLVNSTAVSIAAIVPISTWVGYEIALIAEGLRIAAQEQAFVDAAVAAAVGEASPLSVFIQTIPYRFYPLLTVWLVFLTSWTNLDVGPMAEAEARAASGGGVSRPGAVLLGDPDAEGSGPPPGTRERWWNASIPVLAVIAVALWGLYATGRVAADEEAGLIEIVAAGDPFRPLLWGSLAGCLTAVALSAAQGIVPLRKSVQAFASGLRAVVLPVAALVLAWSLGSVVEALGTATFLSLSLALGDWIPVLFLPAFAFTAAAGISFLIGTSWGTMAILLPVSIPLTIAVAGWGGVGGDYTILLGVISSVLAGAVFGDHCSPISDTTILSSAASGCDHMDHVRTQLPYALLVAAVAVPTGDVAAAFGVPPWICLAVGAGVLYLVLRWRGQVVPDGDDDEVSAAPGRTP